MKRIVLLPALALPALPALAAEAEHGAGHAGGHGEGFLGGLAYSATDPVTFTAFLAFAGFVAIAWRMGAFKTVFSGLDARAADVGRQVLVDRRDRLGGKQVGAHVTPRWMA